MHRLLTLILVALISACAVAPVKTTYEVVKSPNDDRDYRYTKLENGLQVLLISDEGTDKSAAALTAFRGSMHEPEPYPGLAHFLEHMLFIGTEKYPEVDGYQQFIAAGGGSSNAYTAGDHTNYFFDIAPDRLPEALDRFAQFFISPLFSAEYVEREKNAVHSEYQLQIKDDGWRGAAVERMAMNPEHPAARFNIGSLDTLGEGVREALLEFFEANYSADQMSLVVIDNRSLDALEAMVEARFSDIENRNLGPAAIDEAVYTADDLPAELTYQPIKEERSLTYIFPTRTLLPLYRSKPDIYLTNLLGHEGTGSLLQALKKKGWVTSLYAGSNDLDMDESAITIGMQLTPAGAEQIDAITGMLFSYVDLLKSNGPERWRFDEQALVAELGFRFLEQQSATATVYQLAPKMMHLPPKDLLRSRFLMEDFSPALIEDILNDLRPDNVLLIRQLPEGPAQENEIRKEPWFGVPYTLTQAPLAAKTPTDELQAALALPKPNAFLPEDLSLKAGTDGPKKAIDRQDAEIWQHADTSFGIPRANLWFNLNIDGGLMTPDDIAAAQLYEALVSDALNEFAYPTLLAGMSMQIHALPMGFRFDVAGYNDKQLLLADTVLETFFNLQIDPKRFEVLKSELQRNWENAENDRPYTQAMSAVSQALLSSQWPARSLAQALTPISVDALTRWRDQQLARTRIFGLVHGNVSTDASKALYEVIDRHTNLAAFEPADPKVTDLSRPATIALNVNHNDSAYVAYLQNADSSMEAEAMSQLTIQLLRQGYFSSLRTEQQLGYVVAMGGRSFRKRGGIFFVVQSPVAGAAHVQKATLEFLAAQDEMLEAMPEEAFEATRQGLLVKLREADENLRDRTSRYWSDMVDEVYTFDGREQLATAVEALSKADIVSYVRALTKRFYEAGLVVFSAGQFEALERAGESYTGAAEFKHALSAPRS